MHKYLLYTICNLLFFALPLQAKTVTLQASESHVEGQARYLENGQDRPAILILHGFSATHNYPTVHALQDFFNLSGYTTLAPTLSLQIPLRSQPVQCNSLHTHTLQQDIAEVRAWIDWLEQQGHNRIILIGHSSGSQILLEAMIPHTPESIQGLILTSLFYLSGEELGNLKSEIQIAQDLLAQGNNAPRKFNFLFCQNDYLATPESYLSYLSITRSRVLETIDQLSVPSFSLMGSADSRYDQVGEQWLRELDASQTQLSIIEGANHFFTGEHEGLLHDQVEAIINKLANQ